MKKAILTLFVLSILLTAFSQPFNSRYLRLGPGACYATKFENYGLNLTGTYEINFQWEIALAYTYFPEKENATTHMADLDGHFIYHKQNHKLNFYGLSGLCFFHTSTKIPAKPLSGGVIEPAYTAKETKTGVNLGAGLNYKLGKKLNIAPEVRLTINKNSFFRPGLTVQYMFYR